MDLEASSFAGITKSTLVLDQNWCQPMQKQECLSFVLSETAMCSFLTSMTTQIAPGKRVMSEIEPKFFSNFAL